MGIAKVTSQKALESHFELSGLKPKKNPMLIKQVLDEDGSEAPFPNPLADQSTRPTVTHNPSKSKFLSNANSNATLNSNQRSENAKASYKEIR